jgi:hypothetical protein
MSLSDGAAEACSEGYFDALDRPPWDCWLIAFGRTRRAHPDQPIESLISWVSEDMVALAQSGIDATRSGCLYWVEAAGCAGLSHQLCDVIPVVPRMAPRSGCEPGA